MQSTTRLAGKVEGLPSLGKGYVQVVEATKDDHAALVKLAKTSQFTKDFSNALMFSSDAAYQKGWIMKAMVDGKIVGLSCVRHKRNGTTMLYFVTVDPDYRSHNIGPKLLEWVMMRGPHKTMQLNVMKTNTRAIAFYEREGFRRVGEAMKGSAITMEKTFG